MTPDVIPGVREGSSALVFLIYNIDLTQHQTLTVELLSGVLSKRSWVKVGQVRTRSIQRFGKRIGRISPEELLRVAEGLNEIVAA